MKPFIALGGGLAGASALTLVHEVVRQFNPRAPRMDLLGMMALAKLLRGMGKNPPGTQKLFLMTLAGDLIGNALYYSAAGIGGGGKKGIVAKGTLLGLAAGIGAILLPRPMGLPDAPSSRTTSTKLMTLTWYLVGGLVTATVLSLFESDKKKKKHKQLVL